MFLTVVPARGRFLTVANPLYNAFSISDMVSLAESDEVRRNEAHMAIQDKETTLIGSCTDCMGMKMFSEPLETDPVICPSCVD